MNSETIYTTLLDQPRRNGGRTWHGLSYQIRRSEDGKIEVSEHGWPDALTLWEQDGPQLDTLDEATVKTMIESALPVDAGYVIPAPPAPLVPTYTAEGWLEQQGFGGARPTTLLYLKLQLQASGKTSAKLAAAQAWLDGIIAIGAQDPDAQHADLPAAPFGFAEVVQEALAALQTP